MKMIGSAAILLLLAGSAAGAEAETRSAGFKSGVKISRGSASTSGASFAARPGRGKHGRFDHGGSDGWRFDIGNFDDGRFDGGRDRWRDHGGRGDHRRRGRWGGEDVWVDDSELGYSEFDYRHSRTSYDNGSFGQRSISYRGVYDYDRGYPYDFYQGPAEVQRARVELAPPRETWCETQRVWDDQRGREVPVRICRN